MRGPSWGLALAFLSLCLPLPARAGVDRWTPLSSPVRGFVSPVVIDPERPSTLYAVGTGYGALWKSYDAGATWTLLSGGLDADLLGGWDLRGPVFDPADSRRLWVYSEYALWFSADGGGHWTLRQSLETSVVPLRQMVADAAVPERLVALSDYRQVVVSEDGGASWEDAGQLPLPAFQPRLLTHPSEPHVLFVSAETGLFRSTDGGGTWRLSSTFEGTGFFEVAFAPSRPETVYAVPWATPDALLRSDDAGLTWTDASPPGPRSQTSSILVDPADDRRVRVAVLRGQEFFLAGSHDGGATWTDVERAVPTHTTPGLFLPYLAAGPAEGRVLYASPELQKSTDGGRTWRRLGREIQAGSVSSVAATVFLGRTRLYATVFDFDRTKLFASGDTGQTWRELASPGLRVVAADAHRPGRLWGLGQGIFRSDDRGKSWRRLPGGFSNPTDLLLDPVRPRRVFVGTMFGGVWRSDDAGETWVQSTRGLPLTDDCHHGVCPFTGPLAVDAVSPDRVFVVMNAGLHGALGLFRSLDGGAHWHPVGRDLPSVSAVAAHPTVPGVVWAGTIDGVFRSTDGGRHWHLLPGLGGDVRRFLADGSSGYLYATTRQGVFRRRLAEPATWESLDAGLPPVSVFSGGLQSLVTDPASPGRVFAVVPGLGVWTARFVGGHPLSLPGGGRFEARAAILGAGTVSPGLPEGLPPESGLFSATDCGPAQAVVKLAPGPQFLRLFAGTLTPREVELTVVDRLSGVVRTYALPGSGAGAVLDDVSFPAAPFTRTAAGGAAPGEAVPLAAGCTAPEVRVSGRFCAKARLEGPGGAAPALGQRLGIVCGGLGLRGTLFRRDPASELELAVRTAGGPDGVTVFYTALTESPWELSVRDLLTGAERTYSGGGGPVSGIDEAAFPSP